jgi:nicotinamide phosphoribosyltransferase
MKATYGEVEGVGRAIFKDPKTDDGTKKSAKGLIAVYKDSISGDYYYKDDCTWEEEAGGELQLVFKDGQPINVQQLAAIRARVKSNIKVQ